MSIEKAVHGGDVWRYYPVLDFSSNTNPLGPPESVLNALKKNMWRISHYPDDSGRELKKAIADYAGVGVESVILGNGSTEIIKLFAEAFISPGDRVVLPSPTYSEYEYQARLRGAEVSYLPSKRDMSFSAEEIVSALEDEARVLFLCNPNNPTGKTLERKELKNIIEAAREKEVLVLLDEAYIEFTGKPGFLNSMEYENLLVSRSLTKFFTLPGLRLGYGISGMRIVSELEKLRIPWNVNALAQLAGVEALRDKEFARSSNFVESEKKFLMRELEKIGLKTVASDTNFFLISLGGRISSHELKAKLLDKKLLIRDCSSFKALGNNNIRVSVKRREDNQRLVMELRGIMEELK